MLHRICQSFYLNLLHNGYLEKQIKDQTYCEGCQKWVAQACQSQA